MQNYAGNREERLRQAVESMLRKAEMFYPKNHREILRRYTEIELPKLDEKNRMPADFSNMRPPPELLCIANIINDERPCAKVRWGELVRALHEKCTHTNESSQPQQSF